MAVSESKTRMNEVDPKTIYSEVEPGQIATIKLRRSDQVKGFGFNIHGGTDHPHIGSDPGIFITVVHMFGPAADEGTLDVGDKILEINGICVRNRKHHEVVDLFKNATDAIELLIEKNGEAKAFTEEVLKQNGTVDQVDSSNTTEKGIFSQIVNSWMFAGAAGIISGYLLLYLLFKLRNK